MCTKNNSAEASGLKFVWESRKPDWCTKWQTVVTSARQKSRERQLQEFCPNKNLDTQPRSMKKTRIKSQYFLDGSIWSTALCLWFSFLQKFLFSVVHIAPNYPLISRRQFCLLKMIKMMWLKFLFNKFTLMVYPPELKSNLSFLKLLSVSLQLCLSKVLKYCT